MYRLFYVLSFLALCSSCNHAGSTSNTTKEIPSEKYSSDNADGITSIPIYSECSNHNNNLSGIASEVTFIPLAANPPINDFHISSIELTGQELFLSFLSEIMHFDREGHYIKNIGKKGMGPEEFINISVPLQIDTIRQLIYATDLNRQRVVVYHFDGTFEKTFPFKGDDGCIALIDSSTIALRQTLVQRRLPNCPFLRFMDYNGNILKTYPSQYFPLNREKMEMLGPEVNPLWKHKQHAYYLEYGTDTIFRISGDSFVPARVLTGNLKLSVEEHFRRSTGSKLGIIAYIQRYNSGVFESDRFMIFRLSNDYEQFFMVYDKQEKQLHRTYYSDATENRRGVKLMTFFTDDLISGLPFNPQYQSDGKAIALLPAPEICEKKEEVLRFIKDHPNGEQSERLASIIQNLTENDNPLVMIASFK